MAIIKIVNDAIENYRKNVFPILLILRKSDGQFLRNEDELVNDGETVPIATLSTRKGVSKQMRNSESCSNVERN